MSASVIPIAVLSVFEGVPQGSVLGLIPFSLFINDIPTFLPTSVKVSLYADDLAIWASSPSVQCATSTVQAALKNWWNGPPDAVFLSTPSSVSHPSSAKTPKSLKPSLSIFNTPLNFNPNPTFLGTTFDRTLSFKHHVLFLRKKIYNRFRAFQSIASASWDPSNKSLCTLRIIKFLFVPSSPMLPQAGFLFYLPPTSPLWRGSIDLSVE